MAFGDIAPIQPPAVSHGTGMVTVVVGRYHEEFSIHSALLASTSPVFRRCVFSRVGYESNNTKVEIDSDWEPGHTITLHSEDPSIFKIFYDWLYSGRIPADDTVLKLGRFPRYTDTFWLDVLRMADRLEITQLIHIALRKFEELFAMRRLTLPSIQFIGCLFDEAGSPWECLQHQVIAHFAYCFEMSVDCSAFKELSEMRHEFFLSEVARALLGNVSMVDCYPNYGFRSGWFCRQGCPHIQLLERNENETSDPCNVSDAPWGHRHVDGDKSSWVWDADADAVSDCAVQGDGDEAHGVNHANLSKSRLQTQNHATRANLGLPNDFVGPPEPLGLDDASRPPSRVGFPPPCSGFSNMPGPGRMASPKDYDYSTSFTSSGPGAQTPASGWTPPEDRHTEQPPNNQLCYQSTGHIQTPDLSGKFDGLSIDQAPGQAFPSDAAPPSNAAHVVWGVSQAAAQNAQIHAARHFHIPGQVPGHIPTQAPFAGAVPAVAQPPFAVPSAFAGPPQLAVQNARLGQAYTHWPRITAAATAPTWYNGLQTVKSPGSPVPSSAPFYQENWSQIKSSIPPLIDTVYGTERADKEKLNTWTTTALGHEQLGTDIKQKALKKEDNAWGASAGAKEDKNCPCGGWGSCDGCADRPYNNQEVKPTASGLGGAAGSNNGFSGNGNAKANQGWVSSSISNYSDG